MTLDQFCGVLIFLAAMGLFLLHVLTGRRHREYPPAPEYVRLGVLAFGGVLLWRAVDLFQVADTPGALGRMDGKSMIAGCFLFYLVFACVLWASGARLPAAAWARLRHVFAAVTAEPAMIPSVMTSHEVAEDLRARGAKVAETMEGAEAMGREDARRPGPQ